MGAIVKNYQKPTTKDIINAVVVLILLSALMGVVGLILTMAVNGTPIK